MKSDPATRDNSKYCEFHRDYGHRTDDCIQLKREIEYLIRRGYLRRFISPENQVQNQAQNQAPPEQPSPRQMTTQHQQPLGEIQVISRGFAGGGESISARKAHLRSIRLTEIAEIQAVSKLPQLDTSITFSDSDLEGCQHPHDDPLVVRVVVANKTVHRVLIDNGSSADIIFASAFDKTWRNSIYAPFISLYTPLKIPIEENINLPLNLFFLFLFSSSSSLCAPQLPSSSEVVSFEKIVRMGENDVEK